MNRKAVLLALAVVVPLTLVVGVLWVWEEGWVWTPAPAHWWWYAGSAFALGVNAGQWIEAWTSRRQLASATRALREATDRLR